MANSVFRPGGVRLVNTGVGVIFILAPLARFAFPGDGLVQQGLMHSWISAVIAPLEIVCGILLLADVAPLVASRLALLLSASFTGWTAVQLIRGSSSCGCFGTVHISPQFALVLDVVLFAWFIGRVFADDIRTHVTFGPTVTGQ